MKRIKLPKPVTGEKSLSRDMKRKEDAIKVVGGGCLLIIFGVVAFNVIAVIIWLCSR